jgi:dTDP-glucose 4,6-dehydratase
MAILVTGGFGFIGSNYVLRHMNRFQNEQVIVLDKFTYAANSNNLASADKSRLAVYRGDINNEELVANILSAHDPRAIINFAAETHVDRSIEGAAPFIKTNVNGTATLLEMARQYNQYRKSLGLPFKFIQVSTDEVYGSLSYTDPESTEVSQYAPRSPYAASKAAGDLLAKAYFSTYDLPVIVTNCGNNYGPHQHTEKFIPTVITRFLQGRKAPIYGNGKNVREWIYVDDHCEALIILLEGTPGEQYNIGSGKSYCNNELVQIIADQMGISYLSLEEIAEFVPDRPGHDIRYALDTTKLFNKTGWSATTNFHDGLAKTIEWYRNALSA